ncbi:predicted protein [Postia placenta Mad-698-R]|nr:predicted protein [Postia placenta Mad-698-R]
MPGSMLDLQDTIGFALIGAILASTMHFSILFKFMVTPSILLKYRGRSGHVFPVFSIKPTLTAIQAWVVLSSVTTIARVGLLALKRSVTLSHVDAQQPQYTTCKKISRSADKLLNIELYRRYNTDTIGAALAGVINRIIAFETYHLRCVAWPYTMRSRNLDYKMCRIHTIRSVREEIIERALRMLSYEVVDASSGIRPSKAGIGHSDVSRCVDPLGLVTYCRKTNDLLRRHSLRDQINALTVTVTSTVASRRMSVIINIDDSPSVHDSGDTLILRPAGGHIDSPLPASFGHTLLRRPNRLSKFPWSACDLCVRMVHSAHRGSRRTICILLLLVRFSLATLTNRTIDDSNGDSVTGLQPVFAPASGAWHTGQTCPSCLVQPDENQVFDHTWHGVTASPPDPSPRNVTLTFSGTALWVFCVIPNYVEWATTFANLSFELDGQPVGTYSHIPSQSEALQYNVSVYSNTALENAEHEFVMTARRDVNASFLAFDWAMYTYDSDIVKTSQSSSATTSTTSTASATTSPSPTAITSAASNPPVGAIVGGVVGGVGALLIILVAFLFWRCRRHRIRSAHVHQALDDGQEHKSESGSTESNSGRLTPTQYMLRAAPAELPSSISTAASPSDTAYPGATDTGTLGSSAMLSSPALGAAAVATGPGGRRRTKAAQRREELSRQMRDIEAHVADLRRRQTQQTAHPHAAVARRHEGSGNVAPVPYDDSDLRRQIEALQLEVERLRLESASAHEAPPPAYEEEPAWDEHGEP